METCILRDQANAVTDGEQIASPDHDGAAPNQKPTSKLEDVARSAMESISARTLHPRGTRRPEMGRHQTLRRARQDSPMVAENLSCHLGSDPEYCTTPRLYMNEGVSDLLVAACKQEGVRRFLPPETA